MLYVDPSKTIQAPYCPADVAFGLNLGQMCCNELCILKYHNLKGISYSRDSTSNTYFKSTLLYFITTDKTIIFTANWITN